jgi:predicted transcriptional regulator
MTGREKSKRQTPEPGGHSRREREIMDALFKLGRATAAQIRDEIADPPSYTAIRTLLTILEQKGHVRHASDGVRYVYEPSVPREEMGLRAFGAVIRTFFGNSIEGAMSALVTATEGKLSREELDRLARIIAKARKEGR